MELCQRLLAVILFSSEKRQHETEAGHENGTEMKHLMKTEKNTNITEDLHPAIPGIHVLPL